MNTREKFIQATCELMEAQGYHGTGLNQIIAKSGAPRGSLYYHFPGGKEELAAEAIRLNGQRFARLIQENLPDGKPVHQAVRDFILGVARNVAESRYRAGGPLTTVAMETATASEKLNLACREAYDQIQTAFAKKLQGAGFSEEAARERAVVITAAIEGATILARTNHSQAPLEKAAAWLYKSLQ